MPCHDGGPTRAEIEAENARKKRTDREAGKREAMREMDPLLCSACRALERLDYDFDENPALSQWWDKHKASDARKKAAEQAEEQRKAFRAKLIAEALQKPITSLTVEEKKVLKEEGIL